MKEKHELYLNTYMKKIMLKELNAVIYLLDISELNPDECDVHKYIPEDRYKKMRAFSLKEDRARLLGNELIFEYGLNELYGIQVYNKCSESWIKRDTLEKGKPYLSCFPEVCYNMSHSGKYSICSFSKRTIGTDIELIQENKLQVAKSYYNAEEYNKLVSLDEIDQRYKFYEIWVLYESFLKAIGQGLSIPFNRYSFEKNGDIFKVIHDYDNNSYISQVINLNDGDYIFAVCVKLSQE